MLDRGSGRIINISSVIGSSGSIGQANYAAAKAGVFGLTMSLALETARKGITVNSVTPGLISTDMTAGVPPEAMAKVVSRIPAGRLGQPDEVARVVEFHAVQRPPVGGRRRRRLKPMWSGCAGRSHRRPSDSQRPLWGREGCMLQHVD